SQRDRSGRGRSGRDGHRRLGGAIGDPPDRAAVKVGGGKGAGGPALEGGRARSRGQERRPVVGVRQPVATGEHDPDAAARVVGEEERAVVGVREGAALVEGDTGRRRAVLGRATVPRHHLRAVVVGVVRRDDTAGQRIQVLADREIRVVIARLVTGPLVARPAEVLHRAERVCDLVDLLPVVPADVADPNLVRPGPDRHPKRVSETVGDDAALVRIGAARKRVVWHSRASVGIDAQDGAVERRRVGWGWWWIRVEWGAKILAAEGAAFRARRRLVPADSAGGVATRVTWIAILPPVGEVEARAVAGRDVKSAVGAESE